MSKKDNKNKNETLKFRATQEFVNMLKEKMKQANIKSYSEYLRESVKNSTIKQQPQNLDKIRYEINKIGVNLNQLTKYVNGKNEFDQRAFLAIEEMSRNLSYLFESLCDAD